MRIILFNLTTFKKENVKQNQKIELCHSITLEAKNSVDLKVTLSLDA